MMVLMTIAIALRTMLMITLNVQGLTLSPHSRRSSDLLVTSGRWGAGASYEARSIVPGCGELLNGAALIDKRAG
jgi:hypothetical protein